MKTPDTPRLWSAGDGLMDDLEHSVANIEILGKIGILKKLEYWKKREWPAKA